MTVKDVTHNMNSHPNIYTDLGEMLKNPDVRAILVCTPPQSHCSIAEQAAANGVHVMVEKPLTLDLKQADHSILEDRDPLVTAEEGLKPLEIVKAIYKSNEIGKPIKMPMDRDL